MGRRFKYSEEKFCKNKSEGGYIEVQFVPRTIDYLQDIRGLFSPTKPPIIVVSGKKNSLSIYGFEDASGGGFGSPWELRGGGYQFFTCISDM